MCRHTYTNRPNSTGPYDLCELFEQQNNTTKSHRDREKESRAYDQMNCNTKCDGIIITISDSHIVPAYLLKRSCQGPKIKKKHNQINRNREYTQYIDILCCGFRFVVACICFIHFAGCCLHVTLRSSRNFSIFASHSYTQTSICMVSQRHLDASRTQCSYFGQF